MQTDSRGPITHPLVDRRKAIEASNARYRKNIQNRLAEEARSGLVMCCGVNQEPGSRCKSCNDIIEGYET